MLLTDKVDIKLDANGDIVIVDGDFVFTSGLEAVVQDIKIGLRTIRGEWFLDLEEGVPYYEGETVPASEALLGELFDEPKALSAFRATILARAAVSDILSLGVAFEGATREMTVEFRVRTIFGDSDLERVAV